MKIAYLINTYPRPSHSFIRREIHALERMGWNIHRFAMRTDAHMLIDPADIAENTRTEHILGRGLLPVLASGAAYLLRHPLCVECQRKGRVEPATDVDHVIPHKGDMTVFWKGPFQALCHACHSAKTARGE